MIRFLGNLRGDLALKMVGMFGEFSVVSVPPETKHKTPQKIRSEIQDEIRGAFVLRLFDLHPSQKLLQR